MSENVNPSGTIPAAPMSLVRGDWIKASGFHDLTDAEVLGHVLSVCHHQHEQHVKHGAPNGVILFDLDSTLYEVGPRSHQILREFVESPDSADYPNVRRILGGLEFSQLGYYLTDTFGGLDFGSTPVREVEGALEASKKFWANRFFTNEYLSFDEPYAGAVEFANSVYDAGIEIIYLTGRDEPGMGPGTRARLIKDGFPFDRERTHLILKRDFHLDDLEHKSEATEYVKKIGTLIASFENEPPNVVAIHDIFPESIHVFMDSVYSDRPADPRNGLYRIRSFKR